MQSRDCKLLWPLYLFINCEHVIQIRNFSTNGYIEHLVIWVAAKVELNPSGQGSSLAITHTEFNFGSVLMYKNIAMD